MVTLPENKKCRSVLSHWVKLAELCAVYTQLDYTVYVHSIPK